MSRDAFPASLSTCSDVTAADSSTLIAAARHDGDSLTRELAERLYSAELTIDELRAANERLFARAAAAELALLNQTARQRRYTATDEALDMLRAEGLL